MFGKKNKKNEEPNKENDEPNKAACTKCGANQEIHKLGRPRMYLVGTTIRFYPDQIDKIKDLHLNMSGLVRDLVDKYFEIKRDNNGSLT